MILKSLVYVSMLFLSGCSNTIEGFIVDEANKICADKKGIYNIQDTFFAYNVRCGNGKRFAINVLYPNTNTPELRP